jgi:hypothetical protein
LLRPKLRAVFLEQGIRRYLSGAVPAGDAVAIRVLPSQAHVSHWSQRPQYTYGLAVAWAMHARH